MQYQALYLGNKAHKDAEVVKFESVKELDEPIITEKYGIQSMRITTKEGLLNATTIDEIT